MMQQTMPAKKVTVIPPLPELQPENRAKYRQLRVAAYCRVSTKQEEQENSYETQKAYYTEKIQKNPEWEFVGIFADKGLTGTSAEKRPEFMKMIRKCKLGKIDRILIKSVSRFSRNIVDCLHYIRLLAALDIGITFEKENIDTLDMGSETYLSIYSIFSQSESESISGNVTWGKHRSFMNGKVPMNYGSMLGYQRGADGKPEIVEREAETVRRIYREFLAGKSLRQIKAGLEEDQIPTPKGKAIWRIETIHSMLQNERYRGDALLQKTYVPNVLAKRAKKNHGERPQYYVSNNHPAIVDGATFDRVQEELARRRSKRKTSSKGKTELGKYSSKYALTELLVCGRCGSRYRRTTWARNGTKKIVWRCVSRLENGKTYCPDSPTLEEDKLQAGIVRALSQTLLSNGSAIEVLRNNVGRALHGGGSEEIYTIQTQIQTLRNRRMELVRKCVENGGVERCEAEFKQMADSIEMLTTRLEQAEARAGTTLVDEAIMQEIEEVLKKYETAPMPYDDIIIRQLVRSIRVISKEQIQIVLKNGLEILADV